MQEIVLSARDLTFAYRAGNPVINTLSLELRAGCVSGIIGPNGGGKTTLFKLLSGYLTPRKGEVRLFGKTLNTYSHRARARLLAQLPQEVPVSFPFRVKEIVAMGRIAYSPRLGALRADDRAAVAAALEVMELTALAERPLDELSGGEKRRALIASALAQETRVLLLDEPTAALDMGHGAKLMRLLRKLARERSMAVVVVSHDLELLGRGADRLLLFQSGKVLADGTPCEVMTAANIRAAYGLEVEVVTGACGEVLLSYR